MPERKSAISPQYWIWLALCIALIIPNRDVFAQDDACSVSDSLRVLDSSLPTRTDTLLVTGAGPFLIQPLLVSSSLKIWVEGKRIGTKTYDLDPIQGFVLFRGVDPDSTFLFVASFQYFPVEIEQGVKLWNDHEVMQEGSQATRPGKAIGKNITSRGSITRGIMSGTGRDAAIESGLRLEVQGEITDSISVRAVLTDEDTPLLPEGTTSRLDQFDQIFIEFKSSKGKIGLGDLDVSLTKGQFARAKRRIQGVELNTQPFYLGKNNRFGAEVTAIGSTSKGKFRSQRLTIIEGVQGPYRLEGDTSERFILILPGTERVYVDGGLIERGLDSDYIIDYTTAELTFTPSRLVGADSRVQVEFEYTTNQYTRSFLATETEVSVGLNAFGSKLKSGPRLTVGVSAIRESDGDSFAEELGFTGQDSLLISQSGDTLVLKSSAVPVTYDPEALFTQYFSTIGTDGNLRFDVVTRPPNPEETVYRVSFTRVQAGKGSYKRMGSSTADLNNNGIVFSYVGPGNGDYDAVKPLTAPVQKELLDVRIGLTQFRYASIKAEFAASNVDKNTLSSADSGDDPGTASAFQVESKPLHVGAVSIVASTEWIKRSAHFATFDRSRSVEYQRDWNLRESASSPQENVLLGQSEELFQTSIQLAGPDSSRVEIGLDALRLGSVVRANRQRLLLFMPQKRYVSIKIKGLRVTKEDSRLSEKSEWMNLVTRVSRSTLSVFRSPYVEWETERFGGRGPRNPAQSPNLAQPRNPAQSPNPAQPQGLVQESEFETLKDYDEIRMGTQIGISTNQVDLSVENRSESIVFQEQSQQTIQTLQARWRYTERTSLRSTLSLGIRRRAGNSSEKADVESGAHNSILVGATGDWRIAEGNSLSWTYGVQSEQSARLQEIYIKTGQERGQFVWQDVNNDNVIQIEEFVPETIPGEGEYALTYFPSDSLESVTALNASARFNRLGNDGGNRLQRIGLGSLIEVVEKSRNPFRSHLYLMQLGTFRKPGQTLNGRFRIKQDLRILPSNTRFDLDLTWSEIRSFSDLSSGIQRTNITENLMVLSYHPKSRWTTSARIIRRKDVAQSTFASRSFDILGYEIEPDVSFKPDQKWTINGGIYWANRTERTQKTRVNSFQVPFSGQFKAGQKWTARINAEWSKVALVGPSRGLQTYQLTDGRGAGSSWLWGFSLNARVSDVVTATMGYDGRSPAEGRTIHTGRIQFMARF